MSLCWQESKELVTFICIVSVFQLQLSECYVDVAGVDDDGHCQYIQTCNTLISGRFCRPKWSEISAVANSDILLLIHNNNTFSICRKDFAIPISLLLIE